jgi:ComEC/Rec2-related protein
LGVAFALIIPLGVVYLLVCMGIALALIMCGYVLAKRWPRKFSFHLFFLGALFLSALALGFIRADLFLMQQRASSLLPFVTTAKEKATVEGVVVDDPERRATSLHINVAVTNINDTAAHGELLAILGSDEQVQYGDTIVLQGSITEPQPFETNTGHLFDYEAYLQVQGISVMMPHAVIVEVTHNGFEPKFLLQTILFDTKHLFESSVEKLFPEPDGSLLEGILLGERRGMPQSLTQAFVASSLVHVVVLSGHNITIVSEGVFRALAFLPRTAGYGVGAVLMIAFALMTGAGATTMRALIMALVALLARYLHRSTLAMRSLAVASMGMVLWNPLSVLHDSSFILSVLATFGLITLAPWVEQKLWRIPNYKRFDLRSILATTIAVEIFVTPALLYFSGTFSFFALPANSIALPIVPFAMFAGFVAGLVGLVSPALALVPTLLCDAALKWLMLVATTTQSLPFSTATVAQFPAWVFFAVYVPLTVFAIFVYRRNVFESRTN